MQYYIGLDVSLAETSVCVLDETGEIAREAKVKSDPDDLSLFIPTCAECDSCEGIPFLRRI